MNWRKWSIIGRKRGFVWIATLVLSGGNLGATDRYVATNGANGGATSWTTAYTNLQDALTAAVNGDHIYLAGHTFFLTNQLIWAANTNVTIRGGYAATNDVGLPGSNNPTLWPTVLTRNPAYSSRILTVTNVTAGTLDRVTITGGYQPDVSGGGGMYIVRSTGLVISACMITNNGTIGNNAHGGGIYSKASVVTVSNCIVRGNTITCANGGEGGGISTRGGGAMTLCDSIIANNQLYSGWVRQGGGIWADTTCVLRNCLVMGNTAGSANVSYFGDGIYVSGGSTRLENCTVAYNTGQGIYRSAGTVAVTNSIIWGNGDDVTGTVSLAYCNIENGDSNGVNGNFSADPFFERGFYLATNSPCAGSGTNTAAYWGLTNYTTRVDGSNDSGIVDTGYHYPTGYDFSYGDFYVATNGNNGNNGTSWASAYRTITWALSIARDGTRVHIGSGTYNTNGLEVFPLTVGHLMGVKILGTNCATTVLNAAGSNKRVMSITCNNVMISELTLTGGYLLDVSGGGGLLLLNCGGVMVSGCVVTNNYLQGNIAPGGGICSKASIATVSNCLVRGNRIGCYNGGNGGGIYMGYGGMMMLCDSIIANNQLTGVSGYRFGGGIYCNGGGAPYVGGTCVLRNCLVLGNIVGSGNYGDGIYVASGSARLENCTVANNTNQGINRAGGMVTVTNSIIWGNGVDVTGTVTLGWSDSGNGVTPGVNGCLSADPLFEGAATNNYRLRKESPCLNAGINLAWMIGALDLDGDPRIKNGLVDMGAYECLLLPKGTVFLLR